MRLQRVYCAYCGKKLRSIGYTKGKKIIDGMLVKCQYCGEKTRIKIFYNKFFIKL